MVFKGSPNQFIAAKLFSVESTVVVNDAGGPEKVKEVDQAFLNGALIERWLLFEPNNKVSFDSEQSGRCSKGRDVDSAYLDVHCCNVDSKNLSFENVHSREL